MSTLGSRATLHESDQVEDFQYIVNSLGGICHIRLVDGSYHLTYQIPYVLGNKDTVTVSDRLLLKINRIDSISMVPSQCIAVDNEFHTFLAGDFITTHNTTVFMEYLSLFLGVFHNLPGFGDVEGMIYISDSMDNGVKSARKNIEYRYNNSDFLLEWIPEAKFTDNYIEFINKSGQRLGIKMFCINCLRVLRYSVRPVLAVLDDLIASDADASSQYYG